MNRFYLKCVSCGSIFSHNDSITNCPNCGDVIDKNKDRKNFDLQIEVEKENMKDERKYIRKKIMSIILLCISLIIVMYIAYICHFNIFSKKISEIIRKVYIFIIFFIIMKKVNSIFKYGSNTIYDDSLIRIKDKLFYRNCDYCGTQIEGYDMVCKNCGKKNVIAEDDEYLTLINIVKKNHIIKQKLDKIYKIVNIVFIIISIMVSLFILKGW